MNQEKPEMVIFYQYIDKMNIFDLCPGQYGPKILLRQQPTKPRDSPKQALAIHYDK